MPVLGSKTQVFKRGDTFVVKVFHAIGLDDATEFSGKFRREVVPEVADIRKACYVLARQWLGLDVRSGNRLRGVWFIVLCYALGG